MRIVNLTPHPITIPPDGNGGSWRHINSSGLARGVGRATRMAPIDGIPTSTITYHGVDGLPDPVPETWYVVSLVTVRAAAMSGRTTEDLLIPGELVRDGHGVIIGCRSLILPTPRKSPTGGHQAMVDARETMVNLARYTDHALRRRNGAPLDEEWKRVDEILRKAAHQIAGVLILTRTLGSFGTPDPEQAAVLPCGIPAQTLPPCDLPWGHEGDMHGNLGDGFFAPEYLSEHHRRQRELAATREQAWP